MLRQPFSEYQRVEWQYTIHSKQSRPRSLIDLLLANNVLFVSQRDVEYGTPSAMATMQIDNLATRMTIARVEDTLYGIWLEGAVIWRPDSLPGCVLLVDELENKWYQLCR